MKLTAKYLFSKKGTTRESHQLAKMKMTLLKVVDIKEEDYSIELEIQINLQWKEVRATYHNLKTKTYLNALSEDEIKNL